MPSPIETAAGGNPFEGIPERILKIRNQIRACAFNAAEFARLVLHWTPDEKQAEALRTGLRHVILNCSRQWGKTTVAATKIVHVALTRPGSLCVVIAENLDQTAEIF